MTCFVSYLFLDRIVQPKILMYVKYQFQEEKNIDQEKI